MVIFNIREKKLAVLWLLALENYLQVLTSCLPPTFDALLSLVPYIKSLLVKVIYMHV